MTAHVSLIGRFFLVILALAGVVGALGTARAGIGEDGPDIRPRLYADGAAPTPSRAGSGGAVAPRFLRVARVDATGVSADAKAPPLSVRVGKHKAYIRIVFDWPVTVAYKVVESDRTVTVTFARGAQIDLGRLREQLDRGLANPRAQIRDGQLEFTIDKPQALKVRHFLAGPKVVLDFGKALVTGEPAQPAASSLPVAGRDQSATEPARRAAAPPTGTAANGAGSDRNKPSAGSDARSTAKKVQAIPASAGATLTFDFPAITGAAVFRRDPYIWIVFDRRIEPSIKAIRKSAGELIEAIEQLPVGKGTAIRIRPKSGVNPQVERKGKQWLVRLRRGPLAPQNPIALQVRVGGRKGAEVVLPVSELGQIVRMPDPGVGDMLLIATLRSSGHGVPGRRRYAQFDLLASAQGVVVKPLDDDIELKDAGAQGIAVTRSHGLYLSTATQEGGNSGVIAGPRLFDFVKWSKGSAKDYDNALQSAIRATVEVPKGRRDEARLELARLYFAHGMAAEALGVLQTIEFANSPLAVQPEFQALKAATQIYLGRHADARKALLDSRLDKYQEIALWRASMYFLAGETKKAAALFRIGDAVLQSYPEPYRTKFALQRIEAGIDALDIANAETWVSRLDKHADRLARPDLARLRYYQGVLARQGHDLDRAVKYWAQAKDTKDRWSTARAEYALVDLGLQQETITPDEAIERLEKLSYQWRGDELELAVLDRLGELYLAKGDYRKGLGRMRTAVTYFPDSSVSKEIARQMGDTFKSLYLEGKADNLPPLKALALFDDFRELTPVGPDGDKMIQKLVDRLIGVDLLDRAAGLLSHQVRFRLKGPGKAESGAKLALIHLLDRNPKAALLALRASNLPNLPRRIEDDRRRIRAKAKLDLGQSDEAIALLAGDVSMDADLLRLELYWRSKNYAEAAKVLQRLAGEPVTEGGYGPEQARYILGWGVALRLKRDETGLKNLRDLYGPGMAKSQLAETFAFISQPTSGSSGDIEAVARKVMEADGFEGFLRNYRDRLMPPTTAMSTEKTLQDEDTAAPQAKPSTGNDIPPPPPVPGG